MNTLLLVLSFFVTNFYSLQYTKADGTTVSMGSHQNKKVLIVNIATGSPKVGQLQQLQQLQQSYGDSLVIIAFPSNSFGNEPRTTAEVKQFCQTSYGATFIVAARSEVTGPSANAVFTWLADKTANGALNAATTRDFQKFLVDGEGKLIGVYGPSVAPNDPQLVNAITGN